MANRQGDFIWYELITPDPDAAERFYKPLFGWTSADSGIADVDYRYLSTPDSPIAGLMKTPAGAPMPPAWLGYVAVDDVDAMAKEVEAAGGTIHLPPQDIPNVGRFAFVSDPQGAMLYLMKSLSPGRSLAFAWDRPRDGHVAWNELMTSDQAGAWSFYGTHFGWSKDGAMDMGPMGQYEFIKHGGMIGAIMPKMPQVPVSVWSFYIRVPDIDAAAEKVRESGGTIIFGPDEIPGGDFSMRIIDPQGAHIGLVGKRLTGAKG